MRDWKLIDWAVVFVLFFIAFGMLIPLIYRARENRKQKADSGIFSTTGERK